LHLLYRHIHAADHRCSPAAAAVLATKSRKGKTNTNTHVAKKHMTVFGYTIIMVKLFSHQRHCMSKFRFPQDFPPHLDPLAPTEPLAGSAPLGNHPLQFEDMHAVQFEQFCWWLLQRKYDIEGCQLIGGTGLAQGGIDLFAYAPDDKEQIIVFECKCWKSLDPIELKNAVQRFLAGPWATPRTKFTLIVAQQTTKKFARAWHDARQELSAQNIIGELWTGLHLTELIRLHPDILVRFFPEVTASMYCNEWMRRVDFMTQLQKALVDERPTVRRLGNEFLGQENQIEADDLKLEHIYSNENNWTIDSPWVHVDALLPSKRFSTGSVAIVVKKQTTSGLTVALSQEWLLKNLLAYEGAPAKNSYRPFIYGPGTPGPDSDVIIDLHSARLQIPSAGLEAMCQAIDKLTPVYIDALRALEQRWGAEGYPFIGRGDNTVVAICSIPSGLWKLMLDFVREHDANDGVSDWHVFDANPHYIKVYTTKSHPNFDLGYHAFIRARNDIEGLCYGDDVVLTWDPPNSFEIFELDSRKWMSCSEARTWLREKLLPEVGRRLIERELRASWPWRRRAQRRALDTIWAQQTRAWDHRELSLTFDERYRSIGLVATVEELQSNMGHGAPKLYLDIDETCSLFRSVIAVMTGERGHVPYISSNLSLRNTCSSHRDIAHALEQRIHEGPSSLSAYEVRHLLSAMLEGLNDDDSWVDPTQKELIYAALKPLMRHHDVVQLFERHSRWL
jgi:hypothetical protein